MIKAGLHAQSERLEDALRLLSRVIDRADALGAKLYAACARLRYNALSLDGQERESVDYFHAQKISDPARTAQIYLAGF